MIYYLAAPADVHMQMHMGFFGATRIAFSKFQF